MPLERVLLLGSGPLGAPRGIEMVRGEWVPNQGRVALRRLSSEKAEIQNSGRLNPFSCLHSFYDSIELFRPPLGSSTSRNVFKFPLPLMLTPRRASHSKSPWFFTKA